MHIGLAGPVDLRLLQSRLNDPVKGSGYAFPFTSKLASELLDRGHQVSVFALDPGATEPYELFGTSLQVLVHPMRSRARDRALDFFANERHALADSMSRMKPDVVHAHWTYEFALAAQASRLPCLVTIHDWAPTVLRLHRDPYRAVRFLMQVSCLTRARHLTAVSPYVAAPVKRWFRRTAEVVPNGLESSWYVKVRQEHQADMISFGALNAGIDPLKNVHCLLRAFHQTHRMMPGSVHLRLAGGGTESGGELHEWAVAEGMHQGVEFVGRLAPADVADFMDSLDVFVHPSLEESFGMVLLEAMGRRVPVIAGQRSGAVPWLLDHGRAGLLVDVRDGRAIAAGMARLAVNKQLRAQLASRGLERARDFELQKVAQGYERCYGVVLRGG